MWFLLYCYEYYTLAWDVFKLILHGITVLQLLQSFKMYRVQFHMIQNFPLCGFIQIVHGRQTLLVYYAHTLSIPLSLFLCLSVCVCPSLSVYLSVSGFLFLSLSGFFFFSLCLSVFICHSAFVFLFLFVFLFFLLFLFFCLVLRLLFSPPSIFICHCFCLFPLFLPDLSFCLYLHFCLFLCPAGIHAFTFLLVMHCWVYQQVSLTMKGMCCRVLDEVYTTCGKTGFWRELLGFVRNGGAETSWWHCTSWYCGACLFTSRSVAWLWLSVSVSLTVHKWKLWDLWSTESCFILQMFSVLFVLVLYAVI